MANKYHVIKTADAQTALEPQQMEWFAFLLNAIGQWRATKGRPINDYMVFNLTDPHTVAAIEAYIASAEADPAFDKSPGLQESVLAARAARMKAVTLKKPRIPDQE